MDTKQNYFPICRVKCSTAPSVLMLSKDPNSVLVVEISSVVNALMTGPVKIGKKILN